MDVAVKHNGSFISSYVKSYEREHKICTGIGTLTLVVSDTVPVSFDPWDEIDIYENGDFKVRYYVSSVDWSIPDTQLTIECQDNSKRLVDYFIPDQYTVEVPTFTRYWIEKFLDEAGINYEFQTSSQGNLLSNQTSMGLMSAYEQILVLLQLSGWYMFFDGNGVAQIGTLNTDLTDYQDHLTREDVLDIAVKKDDRMLRNRAVVWGNYNPITLTRVFAEITVHTPWNYDHDDLRTMVVANSNIPNNSSAYSIANLLIKEFARITVEKYITAWGARDLNLGDVVKVSTNVYTGSGLITTFGVSMGKEGLVTNLILDERCPRLFGFFNFGDYVYVGTYGDGVWRKHIKFIHTWENFSSGLNDLRVTDLHINNGIFSSVTASGGMFYKVFDDVPWSEIPVPVTLDSSAEGSLEAPGSGLVLVPFSGIHARATIIDRNLNRVIYGLDTYSGLNTGDYFLTLSGFFNAETVSGLIQSGILPASGNVDSRGWLLGYSVGNGHTLIEEYAINVSGDYNVQVLDVENDGKNDYVSVKMSGTQILEGPDFLEWEYGEISKHYNDGAKVSFSQLNGSEDPPASIGVNNLHLSYWGIIDNIDNHRVMRIFKSTSGASTFIFGAIEFDYTEDGPVNVQSHFVDLGSDFGPTSSVDIQPVVCVSLGVYRFIGFSVAEDALVVYEGTEDGEGAIDLEIIHTFPEGYVVEDNEDGIALLKIPWDDLRTDKVLLYDLKTGGETEVIVLTTDFDFGDDSEIDHILVAGDVHSVGIIKEQTTFTVPFTYNYYAINGINLTELGTLIHTGNETTSVLVEGLRRITQSRSVGEITIDFGGSDTSFTAYPGLGLGNFIGAEHGGYVTNSEFTYGMAGGNKLKYAEIDISGPPLFVEVDLSPYTPRTLPSKVRDTGNGVTYCVATKSGMLYLLGLSNTLEIVTAFAYDIGTGVGPGTDLYNIGNCIVRVEHLIDVTDLARFDTLIIDNQNPALGDAKFRVLQREGTDFNIVQEDVYPIRIDISIYSPLLTLQKTESTFNSFSIYGNEVLQTTIATTSGGATRVQDYRYTYLPGSGELGITKQAVYIKDEDVWGFDALTFSGVAALYEDIAGSGILGRIETSNFVSSGQYIFVTTSGDFPQFYQKDPELEIFTLYSGLPDSRATIIRLDDRL